MGEPASTLRPRLDRWTGALPGAGQLGPGWSVGPCDSAAAAAPPPPLSANRNRVTSRRGRASYGGRQVESRRRAVS